MEAQILEAVQKLEKEFAVTRAIGSERHEVNQKSINVIGNIHREFKKDINMKFDILSDKIKCSEVHEKVKGQAVAIKWLFGILGGSVLAVVSGIIIPIVFKLISTNR